MRQSQERTYRTLDETEGGYYRNHPEEIDGYLSIAFEEYAKDSCTAALLSQLRMIARVKDISASAQKTEITRNCIQKALSEKENPKFENVNAIMNAMGYNLTPQKLDIHAK
ncbi:MAG TPA: addiction module antidote protein [Nitrosomonas sp.]|jgi:probable addiction module antidote protein|nr:addiction module antidote protein [Nitrosomonas sp.]